MIGGQAEALGEYRSLFEAIGKNIFYTGEVGNGLVVKLVNSLILSINLFGAIEGIRLGVASCANPKLLIDALKVSTGRSQVVENWARYEYLVREYRKSPHSSVIQSLVDKDVKLALEVAKEAGVKVPVLALISQLDVGEHWPFITE
jgi:3-hydroxyisobutyrate dehydrogenase-like beta-hydroxyacid dehydrogenase